MRYNFSGFFWPDKPPAFSNAMLAIRLPPAAGIDVETKTCPPSTTACMPTPTTTTEQFLEAPIKGFSGTYVHGLPRRTSWSNAYRDKGSRRRQASGRCCSSQRFCS
jgi:hypothetical protein